MTLWELRQMLEQQITLGQVLIGVTAGSLLIGVFDWILSRWKSKK